MLQQQLLKQAEVLIRQGASDQAVHDAIQSLLKQASIDPEEGQEWLIASLYQLGAYTYALNWFTPLMLQKDDFRILYVKCLIRTDRILQALDFLQEWLCILAPENDLTGNIPQAEQLALLCRFAIKLSEGSESESELDLELELDKLTSDQVQPLIQAAVQLGLIPVASCLASTNTYHRDDYIFLLYREGYVEHAKIELQRISKKQLSEAGPALRNASYVYAEILHDEGRLEEAALIFEHIAEQYPELAKARFGACSCYLLAAMNRLISRLELYRPDLEERSVIERYLDDIAQAMQIIHKTQWHTVWSTTQSRNLPIPASRVLQ